MVTRVVFFAYGCLAYLLFLATFVYAIAFVGGFVVATRLDGPPSTDLPTALAVGTALLSLFAIQHSIMARRWFKRWWTQIVPGAIERSTYGQSSSSVCRLAIHLARASAWHVGQWRLAQLLYQTRRCPQWSHCSTWPPSAAVRQCSIAVITRRWAVDRPALQFDST